MNPDSRLDRMVLSMARHRGLDRPLLAVLRRASELLGLVIGMRIAQMRDTGEPVLALASKVETQAVLLKALTAAMEVLGSRWDKLPASERPHFTAEQRYRILWIKDLFALSLVEAARMFRVDKSTIARWSAERKTDPGSTTVGSLIKPEPPVRRYADIV